MDFKGDIRFLLLLGAGVVAAAWAVTYAGSVNQLVQTGDSGYITLVRGLEPPSLSGGGITGGAGNFTPGVSLSGGNYYSSSPFESGIG